MNNVKVFLKEHSNEVRQAVKIGSITLLACGAYTMGYRMCMRDFNIGLELLFVKNPELKDNMLSTIQAVKELE